MSLMTPMSVCGFCFLRAVFFFPFFFSPPYCTPPRPPSSQTRQRKVCYGDGQPSSLTRRQRESISAVGHTCRTHITAGARPLSYHILTGGSTTATSFVPRVITGGSLVCGGVGGWGGTWAAVTTGRPLPRRDGRRTLSVNHYTVYAQR